MELKITHIALGKVRTMVMCVVAVSAPHCRFLEFNKIFLKSYYEKKDYWKDRKFLNYDMKIEFDIPKNMKYIIDLLENLYFNIIMAHM